MKLIMYTLIALNVLLAFLGWLDMRSVRVMPAYQEAEGLKTQVVLIQERVAEGQALAEDCWLFGPFDARDQAAEVRKRFSDVDYFAQLLETEVEKAPAYWVYYGPISTYKESLRQLREFQSKGIDSFIIGQQALKGSISLGVFANIDSAKRMQGIMKRKGYATKMTEIPKKASEFWLSIKVPGEGPLKGRFEGLLSAEKSSLEARQIFCK